MNFKKSVLISLAVLIFVLFVKGPFQLITRVEPHAQSAWHHFIQGSLPRSRVGRNPEPRARPFTHGQNSWPSGSRVEAASPRDFIIEFLKIFKSPESGKERIKIPTGEALGQSSYPIRYFYRSRPSGGNWSFFREYTTSSEFDILGGLANIQSRSNYATSPNYSNYYDEVITVNGEMWRRNKKTNGVWNPFTNVTSQESANYTAVDGIANIKVETKYCYPNGSCGDAVITKDSPSRYFYRSGFGGNWSPFTEYTNDTSFNILGGLSNIKSRSTYATGSDMADYTDSVITIDERRKWVRHKKPDGSWDDFRDVTDQENPEYAALGGIGNIKVETTYCHPTGNCGDAVIIEEINPIVWTRLADIPEGLEQHGFEELNGLLYVVGGRAAEEHSNRTYAYEPVSNTWSRKADLPIKAQSPILRAVNGKLYFIGGHNSQIPQTFNRTFEYDPAEDKWTEKTSMPSSPREDMASAVVDGKIYVMGGLYTTPDFIPLKKTIVYDPVSDTWLTNLKDILDYKWSGDFGASYNGKIYLIGSTNVGVNYPQLYPVKAVYEYDPTTDGWDQKADVPVGTCYKEVEEVGGKLYVISGTTNTTLTYSPLMQIYDINTNSWSTSLNIPYAARGISLAKYNGKIYMSGGFNASTTDPYVSGPKISALYRFDPGDIQVPTPTSTPTPTLTPTPTSTPTPTPTPYATLNFKIKFQGINSGVALGKTIKVLLKQGEVEKYRFEELGIAHEGGGVYQATINDIDPGTYDLLVKGWVHLQKKFSVSLEQGEEKTVDWSSTLLLAGDIAGEEGTLDYNLIDAADLGALIALFDPDNSGVDHPSDLTLDGIVDASDLGALIVNFNPGVYGDE